MGVAGTVLVYCARGSHQGAVQDDFYPVAAIHDPRVVGLVTGRGQPGCHGQQVPHRYVVLARVIQLFDLWQKIADRLIQPQVSLVDGNACKSGQHTLGGRFYIMRLQPGPFTEILFHDQVAVTHHNNTVDTGHLPDLCGSIVKRFFVKAHQFR